MPEDRETLVGQRLLDADGITVGAVTAILIDPDTRRGEWLLIELSDGSGQRLLPVSAASADGAGLLRVPWPRAIITGSPHHARGTLVVSQAAAQRILDHFGMDTP